jgi:2-hydroxychromene-2-carboxylate isomerase
LPSSPASFYFDLASPLAYLASEQVMHALAGTQVEWQPVLIEQGAHRCEHEQQALRDSVELRARALGLQPLRWPSPFPFDSAMAMRVATYAKSIGRAVPFAQAAFRQAFAGGRSLEQEDSVLIAAAACEMHPAAVLRGAALRTVREALDVTTEQARREGVREVPAISLGARLFQGESALAQAAAELGREATGG